MCVMREMLQVHYCISARGTFGGHCCYGYRNVWIGYIYTVTKLIYSCSVQSYEELCIHTYSGDVVEPLYKDTPQNVHTSLNQRFSYPKTYCNSIACIEITTPHL